MRRKVLFAALALGVAAVAHAQSPDPAPTIPSDAVLRQRYALPASRFATIAGERVHYVAEGKGPAILLLHGSFGSLRQLDDWAKALSRHYRVVRFDQSPSGLSGPVANGDYSIEHRIAVIDGLMNRLGIARFALLGTSSSGVPATAYAAARPQRVQALVLANIAIAQITLDFGTMPKALQDAAAEDRTHPAFHRPEFWRQILLANMVDKTRVTPALVAQWTDLNQRALRDPAIGKAARATMAPFSRSAEDLPKITAPTLLLWSSDEHESPLDSHGVPAFNLSAAPDKALEVIPNCGHMMPLDCPARSLARIEPFLARIMRR